MPTSRAADDDARNRFAECARAWRVDVERVTETGTSIIGFGRRIDQPVVLKIVRSGADEWYAGEVIDAFNGQGAVRVYEYCGGAMLLERLAPASSLAALAIDGRDDEATAVIAATIGAMAPRAPASPVPSVEDRGASFERFLAGGDTQLPGDLLRQAQGLYTRLCASHTRVRLLHGDLHHDNILFDRDRGWLAVDPKGVVGEREYEVGAALRNPYGHPAIFADPRTINRRVESLARALELDRDRVLGWAFAQAVLAAIWGVEDGLAADVSHDWIALARAIRPMLTGSERSRP